ncbi:lamin tail domain-containing protein 1 isoform X7 [Mauremys reevesii]|uniref:lamin tail domain-containing protein 1 isoform X7 n=1 Tax=Mauremys reevesii TaxID=260615 RepID=UPI00193EE3B8|nr:lamin tail domain-containing protein 1 isoform X7 [Mauremys reevesii]
MELSCEVLRLKLRHTEQHLFAQDQWQSQEPEPTFPDAQIDLSSEAHHLKDEMAAISGTYEKEMPAPQEQLEVSSCGKMRTEISGHKNAQMETRSQKRQEELDTVLLKKDEDLKNLKLLVAQKETDLQELKTQRTLSSIQLDLAMKELEELNKNILMSQRKYEEEFSQRLKLQDQVLQLKHQLEHQKENCLQGSKEMRQRLAWSEVLILQLEGKLQELSNRDSDSMAKVQKIRETNEAEVKQIQEETATAYHQNFLELQMRLHTDRVMLGKMQEENQCLNQRVDMLTVEVMALQKKELQDLLLAKMKALEAVEEKNISLQNEISLLKSTFGGEKGMEATHFHLASNLSYSGHSPVTSTPIIDASPQPSENVLSPQSLQPASAATMISGITAAPRLAKSARADPTTQKRVLAQGSTNTESPKWSCSRSSSLSLDTNTLGQGQDYFSSLFADSKKNAQHPRPLERQGRTPSAAEDYISSAARHSAIGNLKIAEVHSGGHFVKILNCSPDKEEGIGEYTLQQNVNGHPVTVFKFPPRIRMKANSTVTVWTADAKVPHKPPSDFLWKEQDRFQTGPECTTILCEPNGQAVAWYTPVHWNRRQDWKEQEDDEYLKSSKKPIIPSKMQRDEWEKEPESVIIDTEQEGGVQGQTEERGPVFIKREKKIPATLFPTRNSWCRSPASPTHPHFSLLRPLTMGNDGSSLCRQSRCQSAKPDPAPGTLYAGTSRGRNTATGSFNGKSRRLTRSAGDRKGTLKLLLPGTFFTLGDQHKAGLQFLQSVQNLSFQPPVPRPPPFSTW